MQLIISNKYDKRFLYDYIPKMILRLIYGEYAKGSFIAIDNYFKDVLKIQYTSIDVYRELMSEMIVSPKGHNIMYDLFSTSRFGDTPFSIMSLVKLIEYGNVELRGTGTLNNILNTIKTSLSILYKQFLREVA